MKKYRIPKKNKNKIIIGCFLLLLILVLVLLSLWIKDNSSNGSDFKLGVLGNDGIAIVSFSKDRKMINILTLDPEVKVWIPGGLGWYRNAILKKVLSQEGKINTFDDLLFYNFGFRPDKIIVVNKTSDWKRKYWLKYRLLAGRMLIKEEFLDRNLDLEEDLLDEIMVRDFSETDIVRDDLKVSLFNLGNVGGLATFVSKRLEWSGFSVVSIENIEDEILDKCLIKYASGIEKTVSWKSLNKIFESCDKREECNLNDGEVEIYFDDNFSSVIKYPSYK